MNTKEIKQLAIYDNNNKTIDSITIVFLDSASRGIYSNYYKDYDCLCASYNGISFLQHSTCQRGKHLGNKITFEQLDKNLQRILKEY